MLSNRISIEGPWKAFLNSPVFSCALNEARDSAALTVTSSALHSRGAAVLCFPGTDRDADPSHLPEMRIILLGKKRADKCLAGNTIPARVESEINSETVDNVRRQGVVGGKWQLTVVETLGWWKTFSPWRSWNW